MKKQIFLFATVLFTAGVIIMSGCKKADTTPPVITLTGGTVSQNISDTYVEPGFTATDDKDGDLKSKVVVTGSVTNGSVNTYTLKYNVSDAAGNAATEQTRTVMVKSDQLAGLYDGVSVVTGKNAGTYNYTATVAQSTTAYNKVNITNLGGLGATVVVTATISGTTLTIASQSPSSMTDPGTISGTGTVSGQTITSLNYTISYTSTPSTPDQCSDTWSNKH